MQSLFKFLDSWADPVLDPIANAICPTYDACGTDPKIFSDAIFSTASVWSIFIPLILSGWILSKADKHAKLGILFLSLFTVLVEWFFGMLPDSGGLHAVPYYLVTVAIGYQCRLISKPIQAYALGWLTGLITDLMYGITVHYFHDNNSLWFSLSGIGQAGFFDVLSFSPWFCVLVVGVMHYFDRKREILKTKSLALAGELSPNCVKM